MGTEILKTYDSLQNELEKARSTLKGLNDNIRRIVGRDPPDSNLRTDRKRNFNDRRNEYNSSLDRPRERQQQQQHNRDCGNLSPPPSKRRSGHQNVNDNPKSVFSRLSGPPPRDNERPKLLSRVIRELPTRQEIVAAQGADAESRARNRRMFGCLIGTLQKFCQEESRLKPKEEKKAQIEKKLEEQEILERENLKKERQTLFSDRKKQQQEIKILEFKMNRMKELQEWEQAKKPLGNFIRTKSKPYIYYVPKVFDKKSQQKLKESKETLEKLIDKKREEVQDELTKHENRYKSPGDNNQYSDNKLSLNHRTKNQNMSDDDDEDENDDDEFHDNHHNHSELTSSAIESVYKIKRENEIKTEKVSDPKNISSKSTSSLRNIGAGAPLINPTLTSSIVVKVSSSSSLNDEKSKLNANV